MTTETSKLVNINTITRVYGTYCELVTLGYKPTYAPGGPHCNFLQ